MEFAEQVSVDTLRLTLDEILTKLKEPTLLGDLSRAKESAKDDFEKVMNEVLPVALDAISDPLSSLDESINSTSAFLTFLYHLKELKTDQEIQTKLNELCSILLPTELMKIGTSLDH
eukprot:g4760.t1